MNLRSLTLLTFSLSIVLPYAASQTTPPTLASSAPTVVPPLVPYSGQAEGRTGETSATFLIYKDQQGGEPLFAETQIIVVDEAGHYKVQLGAASPNGLPSNLFASGEARWLEVQIAGHPAEPRVLLASVPYALKAADAATLGGLPASAFALAGSSAPIVNAVPAAINSNSTSTVTTIGGTANSVARFSGSNTIVNSILHDNGTQVGVGTTSPSATLTVDGTMTIDGASTLNGGVMLPAQGAATVSKSYSSQYIKLSTSAYNSSSKAVVSPRFQLMGEVTGNDTASPNATLNLLASAGPSSPAETGFYFNTNGIVHFASGQTFPGTGLTGTVNATGYDLGGSSFATGSTSGGTAYLGFAGNAESSGTNDTGVGYKALSSNTTGKGNTAIGLDALLYNTTGSNNTGLGYLAGPDSGSPGLINSTALGANATVSQSNSLVLGGTTAGNPGASYINVGIGTATPRSVLEAAVSASSALGPALTLTNTAGGLNAAASIDFNTYYHPAVPYHNPTARIEAVDDNDYGNGLYFLSKTPGSDSNGLQTNMVIFSNGKVSIGAAVASAQLEVAGPSESGVTAISAIGASVELAAASSAAAGDGGNFLGGDVIGEGGAETGHGGNGIIAMGGGGSDYYAGNGGVFTGGYGEGDGYGGYGIYATGGGGSSTMGFAGGFNGNIQVTGTTSTATTDFKIDHPLDPANKYLVHSSVESSEMMNIYSGNVLTDELGLATIKLPDWFESENTDFRYQLTVIGQFAQAIIKDKIADGQFRIMTNASKVEVSWQITAVRQDAYAKAHPLVIEQEKPKSERGFYQNPELYGQPAEKQTEWGRRPQQMQRMKKMLEQQRLQAERHSATMLSHEEPAGAVNNRLRYVVPSKDELDGVTPPTQNQLPQVTVSEPPIGRR